MKLELTYNSTKEIVDNVISYKIRKSLVSGLLYVIVNIDGKEKIFSNVYKVRTI